ncbi:MAG: hypothetical protein SFW65_05655 [Alphaproteobacteria bacterium]|nr:hypothetical protein [Alphaproteobacteria bacterium]
MHFVFPKLFNSVSDFQKFLIPFIIIFCVFFFILGNLPSGGRYTIAFICTVISANALFKPSKSIQLWHQHVALSLLLCSPFLIFTKQDDDASLTAVVAEDMKPWDIDAEKDLTKAEKEMMKKAVQRVLHDESNCKGVSYGDRSVNQKGLYYVACVSKQDNALVPLFNVWFSAKDIEQDKPLVAPLPVDEAAARKACLKEIKARVVHPSTIEFHSITGYGTIVHSNGNRTIVQNFTAKNLMNLQLKYEARCIITPKGGMEVKITEIE